MGRKAKLLMLECTSESKEGMSEGLLLRELMRILGFEERTRFLLIGDKSSFLYKAGRKEEPAFTFRLIEVLAE